MRVAYRLPIVLAAMVVVGCGTGRAGREKDIPVSDLPKVVLDAVQKAVPGIEIEEAEVEKTSHGLVYEVEGEAGGKEYELHISADGKLLSTEMEDDDEDEAEDKPEKDDDGEDDDN